LFTSTSTGPGRRRHVGQHPLDGRQIAEITGLDVHRQTRMPRGELRAELFQSLAAARHEHEHGRSVRQLSGDLASDPGRSAGHEDRGALDGRAGQRASLAGALSK
jgi:hypothetical protein